MKWENDTFGLVLRMRQMVYSSKDFESLTLPTMLISLFQNGTVITKMAFSMKTKSFIVFIVSDMIRILATILCVNIVCRQLQVEPSIYSLFIKFSIALIISVFIFLIMSITRPEFEQFLQIARKIVRK